MGVVHQKLITCDFCGAEATKVGRSRYVLCDRHREMVDKAIAGLVEEASQGGKTGVYALAHMLAVASVEIKGGVKKSNKQHAVKKQSARRRRGNGKAAVATPA